ncbi:hypothetical protein [Salmonella phage phC17]|uniref:Uncharacterized protein n=2 Tax=Tequintavirus TaxID=187218 RepID=A0AAF0JZP1_9CAUD|nr:hypothetical protein [Salmonella phage phB7]WGG14711.1 hypothetical protein [Salmonella phage phC17]
MENKLALVAIMVVFQAIFLGLIHNKVSKLENSAKELGVEMCKLVPDNEKCRGI